MISPLYKISVTKPCLESWEEMLPAEGGRYCLSCQRTVTDFSGYSDEELQQYFLQYKGNNQCGRFRTAQLERVQISIPFYTLRKKQPVWRKFLLLLLICFGSTLFQADVQLNGGGLYAQTAITGKQVKKKTGKRKKTRMEIQVEELKKVIIAGEFHYGLFRPESIYELPLPVSTGDRVCVDTQKKDTGTQKMNTTWVKENLADESKPPQSPPAGPGDSGPLVAILPAARRYRSRKNRFRPS